MKVGLDDYLCAHSLEAFNALPRLVLKHAAFTRTAAWWRGWAKRKEEADDARSEASALDLLEDRALTLVMLRRRRGENVARIGRPTDGEAQALRDRCALACLSRIAEITSAYDLAPAALEREGIDDRAVDLWSPLLAVAFVADMEDGGNRSRELLDAAKELATLREADADSGPTARLLEALQAIREREGETIAPADLLEAIRARPGWDWLKSTRRLAGLLNPLGIVRQQVRDAGRRRWCYVLQAEQLADLRARYGGTVDAGDQPEASAGPTFSVSNPVTSGASGDNPHKHWRVTACTGCHRFRRTGTISSAPLK